MSDDTPKRMNSTLPPPGGAEDLYSASTVVGPASAELLALVRSATEEAEAKPATSARPAEAAPPSSSAGDAKLAAMKEAASRSAKEAAANEIARAAAKAASSRPPSTSVSAAPSKAPTTSASPAAIAAPAPKPPATAPPAKAPLPALPSLRGDEHPSTRGPLEETSRRRARTEEQPRRVPAGRPPMPPALAIALVFAAVAFVLAAIVR
jgi:cobalamin biosynthesis Mg chelatase CobN